VAIVGEPVLMGSGHTMHTSATTTAAARTPRGSRPWSMKSSMAYIVR